MRKFAFLLAIVAVFAMSACAFAAVKSDDISGQLRIGEYTDKAQLSINKLSDIDTNRVQSTKVYVAGTSADITIALSFDVEGAGAGYKVSCDTSMYTKSLDKVVFTSSDVTTPAAKFTISTDIKISALKYEGLPGGKITLGSIGSWGASDVSSDAAARISLDVELVQLPFENVTITTTEGSSAAVTESLIPTGGEIISMDLGVASVAAKSYDVTIKDGIITVTNSADNAPAAGDTVSLDVSVEAGKVFVRTAEGALPVEGVETGKLFTIGIKTVADENVIEFDKAKQSDENGLVQYFKPGPNVAAIDATGEFIMVNNEFAEGSDALASNDVIVLNVYNIGSNGKLTNAEDGVQIVGTAVNAASADVKATDTRALQNGVAKFRFFVSQLLVMGARGANQEIEISFANANAADAKYFDASKIAKIKVFAEDDKGYWHSSSSSCSMGFGLAAVAGLAALALRKRSK